MIKKQILAGLILLAGIFSHAQAPSEPGYFLAENERAPLSVNIHIKPGLAWTALSIFREGEYVDLGEKRSPRLGVEVELILPFNRGKWALFLEPAFQFYDSSAPTRGTHISADYNSIEFSAGARHYFFLGKSSGIFVNGALSYEVALDPDINYEPRILLDVRPVFGASAGLGYKYKNTLGAELRYNFERDILAYRDYWHSDHTRFAVILSYNLCGRWQRRGA